MTASPPLSWFRRLVSLALFVSSLGACQGCHPAPQPSGPQNDGKNAPTVRLYVVSDPSGALEPCGCVKDQLGGVDHLAAYVEAERASAPASAFLSAGPFFFMDPTLKEDHKSQDIAKAKTMALSFKQMGLVAFAAGKNDFAAGEGELDHLRAESGASPLPFVREINGIKLGFVGVSASPPGAPEKSSIDAVKDQLAVVRKEGAKLVIALVAVGRGEAKRIADAVPELTAVVAGSSGAEGDANTESPPGERIGNVIVAQTGNHLTTVAVLDLFVRDGSFTFADASGLDDARKRADLSRRIDELHKRIAIWEQDGKVAKADTDARRTDLAKLEAQRVELDHRPAPASGSFFRYTVKEVRDTLGKDIGVTDKMLAYYKQVNEANKVAFADRKPRPAPPGEASYVGTESCSTCHLDPKDVWDKTAHAHAYATLSKQFKEFNLDCVSCHVTGYDLPGGSTVTHVANLENVGCEVCHGAGSKHAGSPKKVKMPIPKPQAEQCLACHHAPHVHEFDAKAKMAEVLGPGHGKPSN
jgi:hypothetical protein